MVTYRKKSLAAFIAIALSISPLASSAASSDADIGDLHHDLKNTFYNPTTFHQSGFGGVYNPSHRTGARNRRILSQTKDIKIPTSAVEHAIPSLGKPNIENLFGHYVHDEHTSPFSSYLYDRTEKELKAEQEEYETKMRKVREEWGAWDFRDERDEVRPVANFDETPYKDLKNEDFPSNVWQTDEKYVNDFIAEAEKLVDRMIEGIYAEYGYPTNKADGTSLSDEEIKARNELFKIDVTDVGDVRNTGFAYINQKGMEALAKKLLHGMITNDEFYFVLGGHSAAAGHGNNFFQQKTMQFHYVMEPVFQKLGMRLISRNLAMGGLGTIHYSMGGAELYGEKDFIMWDSAMTEKALGDIEMWIKQALMGGERVPIIFNHFVDELNLHNETGGEIWYGDVSISTDFLLETTGVDDALTLPRAVRYQKCETSVNDLCSSRNNPNKYDAYCWYMRSDFLPHEAQSKGYPSQASWHPGHRYHQYESRKTVMTILQGFKEALKLWKAGIEKDGFPLKESYWHVGDMYKSVQDSLKTYINGEGKGKTMCEQRFEEISLSRVCRTRMHGMSEFLPVNLGIGNSIHRNMKEASNGWVPKSEAEALYSGIDLLPLSWKIPDTEVDLHAIAIATTYKKPLIDQEWDDENTEEDPENSRRLRSIEVTDNEAVLPKKSLLRNLKDDEVTPGLGWGIESVRGREVTGYCDGSSNSFDCHRSKNSNCLLGEQNDTRNTISGDGLSGWFVVKIPKLKEGLIFARMEWWHPRNNWYLTNDWTEVNNGQRALGGRVIPYPDDVFIDIAVNGKIIETWDKEYFDSIRIEISYNEAFYKFLDDENFIKNPEGEPVEFGLRIRSESDPKVAGLSISHIYYA